MSIGLLPSFITWLPASLSLPSLSTPSLSLSLSLILFPRYTLIRTPVPPAPIVSLSSLWSTALRHDDAVFREHTTRQKRRSIPLLFSQLSGDSPGEIEPSTKRGREGGNTRESFKRRLFQHVLCLKKKYL